MDLDGAGDCEHDWQLAEVHLSWDGALRGYQCTRCGLIGYQPPVADGGDTRPGLDFTIEDLPPRLRDS